MSAIQVFAFFKEATVAGESEIFSSYRYTDGAIEVRGSATAFSLEIQGCLDIEGGPNWTTLCVVDESDFNTLNAITSTGIYSFSAMGKHIRVKINSISGGNLTVIGKFLTE